MELMITTRKIVPTLQVEHGLADSDIQVLALNTLNALKHSVKAGPRHIIPGHEEIEALLTRRKLTTIVFFLDETFEEITYDMSTTVVDVVQQLAGLIKLSSYSNFSLFECCKVVTGSKAPDLGNEEYIGLDENKYIGDLLVEFKAAKDPSKGEMLHYKLIFKKKLFRETDEAVIEPMFVQLSYVQMQHDYILGNYPIGRDDAAQLSALQILAEIGFLNTPESCSLGEEICVALQTHINDVMLRRYSKARSVAASGGSLNGDISSNSKPPNMELYEKHVQELSKLIEEFQKNVDQLLEELCVKKKQEEKMQEELDDLKESLKADKQNLDAVTSDCNKLLSLCNEKDKELQAAILNKRNMESRMSKLNIAVIENTAKKDFIFDETVIYA
ncbi:kinesin-like protein KIN-14I [Glycine soja]|uniref:kinesin-like protein KIN-14I n=1 Tax=Glycine max TaxID=3847 RepID=UPI00023385CB|nr:kinesin-like protein KIN-14I [Glycine max]XP_028181464.1 kinesin-like protein KIN-14I [Glycine soja]